MVQMNTRWAARSVGGIERMRPRVAAGTERPRWYDSPLGYAHRIRSLDGDFLRDRLTLLLRPAVIAFLVLAAVLTALVFVVSAGRALDVAQYAGLVAVAVVTAAFAVGLMYAESGSGDPES